jgi:hypothetical protein
MPNPPIALLEYIRAGLADGKTADALRGELLAAGWPAEDIGAALSSVGTTPLFHWKPVLIAVAAVAVILSAAAALLYFRNSALIASGPKEAEVSVPALSPDGVLVNTVLPKPTDDGNNRAAVVDDSEFSLLKIELSSLENGFLDAEALKDVTVESSVAPDSDISKQLSGESKWNQAYVDDLVVKNSAFISDFAEALKKPGMQIPQYANPRSYDKSAPIVELSSLINLAKVMALDAVSTAKKGDIENASSEAMAVALYGERIQVSQVGDLGYAGGIALKKIGLDALIKIMAIAPLSSDSAKRVDSLIASFGDTALPLATAFKIWYWGERNQLDAIVKNPTDYFPNISPDKFNDPNFFNRNETLNLIGDNVRDAIVLTKERCREFIDQTISDSERVELEKMNTENGFGKWFASKTRIGWAVLLNARCADAALVASVRSKLAPMINGK